jgi:hypothetical protein
MIAKSTIADFCAADRILMTGHVSSRNAAQDVGSSSLSDAFN